ncbi:MAG: hypothetical protein A2V60_01735 [Candidatus Portnoybacteria bacterium RIFCSPHIGHO2_01_FULL_39_19]|nr:MAG: hypothetical protein A2V60_01735 [Candidatus Portnoybacteria bacterium RIFCSPHIGHO2_01_FULL_39_19]
MEGQKKKSNHYVVVVVILILIIFAFAYNQWGKRFLPEFKGSSGDKFSKINYKVTEGDIQIGNKDAEVTIIEYYSYACDFCRSFHEDVYPLIIEDYVTKGKVRFVFRPFPPYELGQAVPCANEQDKFLEYHTYLFDNIENLEKAEDLGAFAREAGLDEGKFSECYNSEKYKKNTEDWYSQGMSDMAKAEIPQDKRGTPVFFINGEPLLGTQPYIKFIEIIENKLK